MWLQIILRSDPKNTHPSMMDFEGTLLVHCHNECHVNAALQELEQSILASMAFNASNDTLPTRELHISVHHDCPNENPTQTRWTKITFKHPFHLSENSRIQYFTTLHITAAHHLRQPPRPLRPAVNFLTISRIVASSLTLKL